MPDAVRRPGRGVVGSLEVGRAVAAFAVLAFHAAGTVEEWIPGMPSPLFALMRYGYLGVDFFFVLSGFIIYYTNSSILDGGVRRYFEKRLVRVYVPYLPVGIGMAVLYTVVPHPTMERDWSWFATATLLPSDGATALSVAWTLRHEVVFYAIFGAASCYRRLLWPAMVAWGLTILVVNGFHVPLGRAGYPLSLLNIEFLFGMLAAAAVLRGPLSLAGTASLWTAATVAFSLYILLGGGRAASPIFALGVAASLVPIVHAERASRYEVGRFWRVLGASSYALYLIHRPIVSVLPRVMKSLPWSVVLVAAIAVSVLAGLAYHVWFEKPALAWCHGRLRSLVR